MDKPEALRLADESDSDDFIGWDALLAEFRRLHQVNQELAEALKECERYGGGYTNCEESYLPPTVRDKVRAALAKHKEQA